MTENNVGKYLNVVCTDLAVQALKLMYLKAMYEEMTGKPIKRPKNGKIDRIYWRIIR